MKRIISLALAMMFVLIATLSVSAAYNGNGLNDTNKGFLQPAYQAKWHTEVEHNTPHNFGYDTDVADEFFVINGGDQKIWNWYTVADATTAAAGDRITAKFSATATAGIMFGANKLKESTGLNAKKSGALQYLYAGIKYDGTSYSAVLLNDSSASGTSELCKSSDSSCPITTVATVPLTGISATDDITLAVDFTAEGAVKVFVNGNEVISETGLVPYGNECGFALPYQAYTDKAASAVIITVDEYTIGRPVTPPPAGGNGGATVPDTGDATAIYLVLSAVALSATFAAVVISRKKRIAE